MRTTSDPRSAATFANAKPILPDEWFDINLTGSNSSIVGPADIRTFLPIKERLLE